MRVNNIKIFFNSNNMENIIEPTESFDFSKVTLAHPVGIQGGAYFTKIEYNKKPLYIQTTKSQTRQGIIKTGKKYYSDLMFDKNSETLINWFENLEEKCKKLIYEKKEAWFQGNLEENDIDSAFNSILRVYKSGKYYLVRTNIRNNKDDNPIVKIYNEQENHLTMHDIVSETNIISILEIQGIKFTSRNFQIEIELKQIMVLNNEPLFDNCLIKTNKNLVTNSKVEPIIINNTEIDFNLDTNSNTNIDSNTNINNNTDINSNTDLEPLDKLETSEKNNEDNKNEDIVLEFEDLNEDINENNDDLREITNNDLHLDKIEDIITLKKPTQVYFELYKEARKKAKQAKKNAILAYLEAKNIKKTYMIENINDSDSEFDAEIDDVSESELDGL
jgi:hypothetical protein